MLPGCLRSSTLHLFRAQWRIFCGLCQRRGVAPVHATVPVVVVFLIHLCYDKGLSVSAVMGCGSALNLVLALKGGDLTSFWKLRCFLVGFSRTADPVELRPPAWGVALVLQSLTGAQYEPSRTCEEHFLAQETLFLLTFASAKRIGEPRVWVFVSLIPGFGVRCPFLLSQASWRRFWIPPPLLLGLRAFLYRPYQARALIAMGDCYVLCGWSGITLTVLFTSSAL